MSVIISNTENGYRRICERCGGTGIDPDSAGGADPCFNCENGIEEVVCCDDDESDLVDD